MGMLKLGKFNFSDTVNVTDLRKTIPADYISAQNTSVPCNSGGNVVTEISLSSSSSPLPALDGKSLTGQIPRSEVKEALSSPPSNADPIEPESIILQPRTVAKIIFKNHEDHFPDTTPVSPVKHFAWESQVLEPVNTNLHSQISPFLGSLSLAVDGLLPGSGDVVHHSIRNIWDPMDWGETRWYIETEVSDP